MAKVFTDSNFSSEVLSSDIPVLVDFWAVWCGPCQMMGPVIEKLAQEYEGRCKIGKLNVEEEPQTANAYGIMSIPSFKIFKNGQVVSEFVGGMSESDLRAKIEAVL